MEVRDEEPIIRVNVHLPVRGIDLLGARKSDTSPP
jgi:hypothetical protein